jgi:hypothetical protein
VPSLESQDDLFNDILFMLTPLDAEAPSKDQLRFFEEFFQEEFANPKETLRSAQKTRRCA